MKQTFRIPENCNATVEQVGNKIVVTFEPKLNEFKKGDFVTAEYKSGNAIAIIKDKINENIYRHIAYISKICNVVSIDSIWGIGCSLEFRYSTTEERKFIIDKLESEGWKYNEETCELERIKWKPKEGEKYCFINSYGFIQEEIHTWRTPLCTNRDLINCFKPNSLDQDKVKRLFAEFIQKVKDEHGIDY